MIDSAAVLGTFLFVIEVGQIQRTHAFDRKGTEVLTTGLKLDCGL